VCTGLLGSHAVNQMPSQHTEPGRGAARLTSELTSHQSGRIKAVAIGIALFSWLLPLNAGLLLASPAPDVAIAGLVLCGACFLAAIVLALATYCPWCCERLFFVVGTFNSPSWHQLARQLVPYEVVVNDRFTCPHCRSRFKLAR
jgi:hypothetical protein